MSGWIIFEGERMNEDQFIDHEVRVRILERLSHEMNKKLNAIIGIVITGVVLPVVFKMWGG